MSFFSIENLALETTELLDADGISEELERIFESAGFHDIDVLDVWEDPAIGGWRVNVDVEHDDYVYGDEDKVDELVMLVIDGAEGFLSHLDSMNVIAGD